MQEKSRVKLGASVTPYLIATANPSANIAAFYDGLQFLEVVSGIWVQIELI